MSSIFCMLSRFVIARTPCRAGWFTARRWFTGWSLALITALKGPSKGLSLVWVVLVPLGLRLVTLGCVSLDPQSWRAVPIKSLSIPWQPSWVCAGFCGQNSLWTFHSSVIWLTCIPYPSTPTLQICNVWMNRPKFHKKWVFKHQSVEMKWRNSRGGVNELNFWSGEGPGVALKKLLPRPGCRQPLARSGEEWGWGTYWTE